MLGSIRNFSKTVFAKILLGVIIIPFVFWGMGGVFSGGNTNVVAKINSNKISTQDFMDHINTLNINPEVIRENLDNSILKEILSDLVSRKLLEMEMKRLNIKISDLSLIKILKKDKNFIDKDNKFSRTKYEKFLLTNNISANNYEEKLRYKEKQKILFHYISGGTSSAIFHVNNIYNSQNKKIKISKLNLKDIYINESEITENQIVEFIGKNKDNLKEKKINISLTKIDSEALVSTKEYSQVYFDKIDEIDNDIINGNDFKTIIKKYNLKIININNFNNENIESLNLNKENFDIIYNKSEVGETKLIDNENEYILYSINEIKLSLPITVTEKYKDKIKKLIVNENQFEINQEILKKINTNKFTKSDFNELSSKNEIKIQKINIENIRDDSFFAKDSLVEIYKSPVNSYLIAVSQSNEPLLIQINAIKNFSIDKTNISYDKYFVESNINLKNNIYSSYDYYLNDKYDITLNQKTLNRIKNYFK